MFGLAEAPPAVNDAMHTSTTVTTVENDRLLPATAMITT